MRIQEKRGIRYVVAFAVLVLSMVANGVESKWGEEEPLLAYLIDSGMINPEMADLLHANCMFELSHAKKTYEDLKLYSTETDAHEKREFLNARLLPHVNQVLIDCIRGRDPTLRGTGEEQYSSNSWYNRLLGFLFSQHGPATRRALAETFGEAPAPSPAVSSPSPAPSFPLEPSATNQASSPPSIPFFPTDLNNTNLQPTAGGDASGGGSDKKTSKKTVVIAVSVTASVTFVFVALIFLLWRRCCGGRYGRGRNDERPLLSLSLSDYSIASPQKLFSSMSDEKFGHQSFDNKLNHNKTSGNFYAESHSLSNSNIEAPVRHSYAGPTNIAENSLPMPPGLPPLRPPPGRANSPKPPPATTAPPSPAPAPPPSAPAPPPPPPPGPPPLPLLPVKAGPRAPPPPPPRAGPPPPPRAGPPPPRPPPPGAGPPPPRPPSIGPKAPRPVPSTEESEAGPSKTKLKPFFWDKVLANPDHSMVWHQIKSGSFQFNEEMIESLFGYSAPVKNKNEAKKESVSQDGPPQYIQIIDAKKAQNLSIMLKALNVTTEEVCDALEEGNELPAELIQTFLKMAPTSDEELKLRLYSGELSLLGPAERFLKILVNIPFAFKRLESLLFMCTLQEDMSMLRESFAILEAACTELRKSRLFLKLLEAVLKTGNRMNDGTFRGGAQAFKLDTLLKLSDVKGTDGKTTLLHFVVQEIIRSEGVRAAREAKGSESISTIKSDDPVEDPTQDSDDRLRSIGLQVVSGLGNELENVRKAAILDADSLTGTAAKLGQALAKARDFLNRDMKNVGEESGFLKTLRSFVQNAEVDVMWVREEEKLIMAMVKSTADYFHGNAGKDEGLRLFVIVRDFLIILDKVCKEVKNMPRKTKGVTPRKEDTVAGPTDPHQRAPLDPRQRLFPAIKDRRMDSSSSDDES